MIRTRDSSETFCFGTIGGESGQVRELGHRHPSVTTSPHAEGERREACAVRVSREGRKDASLVVSDRGMK